jgi:hypothetical protein
MAGPLISCTINSHIIRDSVLRIVDRRPRPISCNLSKGRRTKQTSTAPLGQAKYPFRQPGEVRVKSEIEPMSAQ